jgi:arylformamidase
MAIYDLTHALHNQTPVYPGELPPEIRNIGDLESKGYCEKWLSLSSHTGTHMDAPAHMLAAGKTLDQFPVSQFSGNAQLVYIPPGTGLIEIPQIERFSAEISDSDFILFVTGWSRFWAAEHYFRNFPVMSEKTAGWLTTFSLKGIGVDAISVDPTESDTWPVHKILFSSGIVIIENLVFPENFKSEKAVFHCFPLKIEGADGSPVRAVLEI